MLNRFRIWWLLLALSAFPLAVRAAGTNEFATALTNYQAGHYELATQAWAADLARHPSAEAWLNYGLAAWQAGRPGVAVLAWERARWINPYDTASTVALRFAEGQGMAYPIHLTWTESFSLWLPADAWGWLAGASFWLVVILVVVPRVGHWTRRTGRAVAVALLAGIFLLTLPGLQGVHSRSRLAVVLTPEVALRQTPTATAQTLERLAAGDLVRAEKWHGDYCLVRTANDASGWVSRRQIQFIADLAVPAWSAGDAHPN